jgi:two-component system, NarL family, response regulator DesR
MDATPPQADATRLLSPREQEVQKLITAGLTNKRIAEQFAISVATVNDHVTSVLTKLGAVNRTQAVAIVTQSRRFLEAKA